MLNEKQVIQIAEEYDRLITQASTVNYKFSEYGSEHTLFKDHPVGTPYCIRYIFSDSIILVADGEDSLSFLKLLVQAWRFMQVSLSLGIPIRGGIAFGEMYLDPKKGICLGHALTKAYQLEEKQNWIGIAVDPSVESAYADLFSMAKSNTSILGALLLKYPVPFKKGNATELHTVNWRWNLIVEKGTRSLFSSSTDEEISLKVNNTLAYARKVRESRCAYAEDESLTPAELRSFWIGRREPPFPHGDDL
jgi:hypothetical protein